MTKYNGFWNGMRADIHDMHKQYVWWRAKTRRARRL
jgi:hypothetical protein